MLTKESILPKGKYKGKKVEEVLSYDPNYVSWCVKNWDDEFSEDILTRIKNFDENMDKIDSLYKTQNKKQKSYYAGEQTDWYNDIGIGYLY